MSDLTHTVPADDGRSWGPWKRLTPAVVSQWCLSLDQPWDVIVDGLQDLARQGYLQLGYDTAATCWIRGRARDQSDAGG